MEPPTFRILHVTDQHFGNSHFWCSKDKHAGADYSEEIGHDVATNHFHELDTALNARPECRPPFDAVVLGGDFTDRYATCGFDIARRWIQLLRRAGYARAGKILLVPGNHDVNLGALQRVCKTRLPWPRAIAEEKYRAFLKELGPPFDKTNDHLSVVTRVVCGDQGLILVGLNSCRMERFDAQGWGYVGMDQIQSAIRTLEDGPPDLRAQEGDILVAFTHHNPLPLYDIPPSESEKTPGERNLSFLMDASSLLTQLTAFGFGVIMHGHAHIQRTVRLQGYDPRPRLFEQALVVSGQGTFGFIGTSQDLTHHFAVLNFHPEDPKSVRWRDRRLGYSDFIAAPAALGTRREWRHSAVQSERGDVILIDRGWHGGNVTDALRIFKESCEGHVARDKAHYTDSWAPLWHRPVTVEERQRSLEWRRILENLALESADYLRKARSPKKVDSAAVASVVDEIFEKPQDPGDVSATYLPQFIAWKLLQSK